MRYPDIQNPIYIAFCSPDGTQKLLFEIDENGVYAEEYVDGKWVPVPGELVGHTRDGQLYDAEGNTLF